MVDVSCAASSTPSLWLPGMNISGPLNSLTSSRKIATFIARGSGIVVVVLPGAEILMPLPDVAVERHLAVDLELMHVHRLAEHLHHRLDHARMARESRERRAVHVRGEIGAHRVAALFAHVLLPVLRRRAAALRRAGPRFRPAEQAGKNR